MKTVGLFEAKTKLSEICRDVSLTGKAVTVTHRGQPMVRIEPIPKTGGSVWDRRTAYIEEHGPLKTDFKLPTREKQTWRDPLE